MSPDNAVILRYIYDDWRRTKGDLGFHSAASLQDFVTALSMTIDTDVALRALAEEGLLNREVDGFYTLSRKGIATGQEWFR
ncbi:hypothetical protein [Ancylobacter defluvii]|uniref:Uncharacterized protein n=1 Tax=Ancylobacter defluvii TaxID=1282440 RepID=A0A9W6NDA7_9HYPH|nr:hypothetical protein [Ancylobacter defluvii]MBS7588316.1 hypothetical protein [Ancylobacter defluvii]GLK86713.1 hypothetical protein GCM10017653_47830 [Ancylobacter defluvii]